MKTLYLIRGLPGSGKSTFAQELADGLGCLRFEADMYHVVDGVYQWKPENVHAAHQWCQRSTQDEMVAGRDVIVSNTFTTEKELKPYLQLAQMLGYRVVSLVVENRHGGVNVHDVPAETLTKMRDRFTVHL